MRDYRIEKPVWCRTCRHFGRCTKSEQGRTVVRHIFEDIKEKVARRIDDPATKAIYQRRKNRSDQST